MGGMGLIKKGWNWLLLQRQILVGSRDVVSFAMDKLVIFIPMVYRLFVEIVRFIIMLVQQWRFSIARGVKSLCSLGTTSLFLVLWSFFFSLTSTNSLLYVLLSLGAAGAAICCLGYRAGFPIAGLFSVLIMWKCSYFWLTGMLLISGGYMLSVGRARVLILMATTYAVFCVYARVGWHGVFLSLNLSFLSNDILNKLLQEYDCAVEGTHFEEQKQSEIFMEDFCGGFQYPPFNETENVAPFDETENVCSDEPSCTTPNILPSSSSRKESPPNKVIKPDTYSLDEVKRIVNSSNHYEVLGFLPNDKVDAKLLKQTYKTKVLLVHPDKNMGNSLSCESFRKLQCAYEVLGDSEKKREYDEQMRKEKSRTVVKSSCVVPHQDGAQYRSEESRCIDCTKCGNSHVWVCTKRNKFRARWCQVCSLYHQARDGEGWVEKGCSKAMPASQNVEIPRAFVCAESKIFDVSEWAICQGMLCKPNTHGPSFHVHMVGRDKTGLRSKHSRYSWGLGAEMITEVNEFEMLFQHILATGTFAEPLKRKRIWSAFKINQKGMKSWRKSF